MADIPSTPADGNVLVKIVPAIADTSAPKLTELDAAGAVDISCYLTGGGYKPSLSEQVITDERLCTTQTYEQKGRSQRGLEVEYIDNTNSPNAARRRTLWFRGPLSSWLSVPACRTVTLSLLARR